MFARLTLLLLACTSVQADLWCDDVWGDLAERRKNTLDANQVWTTLYNSGLLGRLGPEYSLDWPGGRGDEYAGEFALILGSAVHNPLLGREVVSVLTTQSPARGRDEVNPANPAEYWTLAPLPGLAADTGLVALSTQPWSWPASWPDTDAAGWNSGLAEGARPATQEAYFWQDDSRDHEFLATEFVSRDDVPAEVWLHYFPDNPAGADVPLIQPHPGDEAHGGLGLKIATRAYEWSEPALQDLVLLTYDIHNTGGLPLEDSRLGLVLGTYVGGNGDSTDDRHSFDRQHRLVYVEDADDQGSPGWDPLLPGVRNVGVMGVALLETPGDGADWIDNDGDAGPGWPVLDAPRLQEMLTPRSLVQGEVVVLIDYADSSGLNPRRLVRVPAADEPYLVRHRGQTLSCAAGQAVAELSDNRLDDNFNGLIDEGAHQTGRAFVDWSLLGLELPAPGAEVPVPADLLQAVAAGLDERPDDGIDNDGDWGPQDDLGADARAGTGDVGEADGQPTVGEPHFEWRDPDESDQLGLTGFDQFTFPEFSYRNDADLWQRLTPQVFDSTAGQPGDWDCLSSCGPFPLAVGSRARLSVAVLFAVSVEELFLRAEEAQRFYNSEFRELSSGLEEEASSGRRACNWANLGPIPSTPPPGWTSACPGTSTSGCGYTTGRAGWCGRCWTNGAPPVSIPRW